MLCQITQKLLKKLRKKGETNKMKNLWRVQFLARTWQWISGDMGVGLSVLGEFSGSGGMSCDILSKRDLLPAVGAMRGVVRRMGAVVSGRRTRAIEINDGVIKVTEAKM